MIIVVMLFILLFFYINTFEDFVRLLNFLNLNLE